MNHSKNRVRNLNLTTPRQRARVLKRTLAILSLAFFCACSALSQPTATSTPSPTATMTPTEVPTNTATALPTASPTATLSPTATDTATVTPTPAPTLTPSITPWPETSYVFDNWDVSDLVPEVKDGIDNQMIAFVSANRQETIANIATAQPFTGVQTVYFASPLSARSRIPILELVSTASLDVFIARPGNALAFVQMNGDIRTDGLYILDLATGFSARVLAGANPLVQRGRYMPPSWSPDGEQLALALATGYDMDIYLYAKDGSGRTNITNHVSYDFWPSWSPDGRSIAFVSDRADCVSWNPGDAGFCDGLSLPAPTAGMVYLYDLASGSVRRIADVQVSEAPYWINSSMLALTTGDPFDLLNPQRHIWRADINSGEIVEARLPESAVNASYLSESWSPGGNSVLVHIADSANRLVLLSATGNLLGQAENLDFPRYGLSSAWAPAGERIAIGGTGGHCPYGVRVMDSRLRSVASAAPPPTMCDPQYSFDGRLIAFAGVNPRVDGRNDIYVASANGFGASSITSDLRGQVELIGWVGGSS